MLRPAMSFRPFTISHKYTLATQLTETWEHYPKEFRTPDNAGDLLYGRGQQTAGTTAVMELCGLSFFSLPLSGPKSSFVFT
jgi:hypothetical protein